MLKTSNIITAHKSEFLRASLVAVIFLMSFSINLLFLVTSLPNPDQAPPNWTDAQQYNVTAIDFAFSAVPQTQHVLFTRGLTYPIFVALIYRGIGSPNYGLIYLMQAIILSFTVLLTYFVGRSAFNHTLGICAAFLYTIYLPTVWHTLFLLTETVLAFVATFLLLGFIKFIKRPNPVLGILTGIVLGWMSISHSAWQFIPYIMIIAYFILGKLQLITRSRLSLGYRAFVLFAGVLLVIVPYRIYAAQYHLPMLGQCCLGAGAGGGWTFYVASRIETNARVLAVDYEIAEAMTSTEALTTLISREQTGEIAIEPILLKIIKQKLNDPVPQNRVLVDADFYRAGIANWLKKPITIPQLLWIKTRQFLIEGLVAATYVLPNTAFYNTGWLHLFNSLNPIYVLFIILGLVWVVKFYSSRLILFVPLVFQTAVSIITYPEERYKYPNLSAAFILVALGLLAVSYTLWSILRNAHHNKRVIMPTFDTSWFKEIRNQ